MKAKFDDIVTLQGVTKYFSGLMALGDVSCAIKRGQIKALIGPNGAGKSTLLNIISGTFPPDKGSIIYQGRDIAGLRANEIAGLGMSRTFQLIRLFTVNDATVMDNLLIGAHKALHPGLLASLLMHGKVSRQVRQAKDRACEAMEFVGLAGYQDEAATSLSFGNQRLLELARALMAQPDLLLLDEPASGLNDAEVEGFMELLKSIRDKGITILLVEHNMKVVMNISDDIVVLDFGQKLAEGTPSEVRNNPEVMEAYLGTKQSERKLHQ
jgi:branched-chain amino acid transport system ATP-binding protein